MMICRCNNRESCEIVNNIVYKNSNTLISLLFCDCVQLLIFINSSPLKTYLYLKIRWDVKGSSKICLRQHMTCNVYTCETSNTSCLRWDRCGLDLLPLVVSECDALWGHLEVHNGGSRWRSSSQCLRYGLSDSLRPCQWFHLHWVDVENIACCKESRHPSWINGVKPNREQSVHAIMLTLSSLECMLSATRLGF